MSSSGLNRNGLFDLPLELQEDIIALISDVESQISFAIASYPRLWRDRRVPPITRQTFACLFRAPTTFPAVPRTRFGRLPPELAVMMLQRLPLWEMMAVVFLDYHQFRFMGIAPALSQQIKDSLIYVYIKDRKRPAVEDGSAQQPEGGEPHAPNPP